MTRLEDDNPFKTDPAVEAAAEARRARYRRETAEWRERDSRVTFWVNFVCGFVVGAGVGLGMAFSRPFRDHSWALVVLPIAGALICGLVAGKRVEQFWERDLPEISRSRWWW